MDVTSVTTTLNAAGDIGPCLDSVSWCDEHIVIDEFSDDRTVLEAEAHGATVIQRETPADANSYEILRRVGVEQAANDWILRIDADERSHPQLNDFLQSLVAADVADVIMIPRQTFLGDRWIDHGRQWWPDRSPIVFRRDHIEIGDSVHRSLQIDDGARVIELPADLDAAIRHYSYDSFFDLIQKRARWAKLEADDPAYNIEWYAYLSVAVLLESAIVDAGYQNGLLGLGCAVADGGYHLLVAYHLLR